MTNQKTRGSAGGRGARGCLECGCVEVVVVMVFSSVDSLTTADLQLTSN